MTGVRHRLEPAGRDNFRMDPGGHPRKRLADLVIPERFRAAHRRGLKHFLTTGEGPLLNRRLELAAIRKDGVEIPVELTISPLSLPDRYEFSAFIRDITQRRASEEQIVTMPTSWMQ